MKKVDIEFGADVLALSVPDSADALRMPPSRPLNDPESVIKHSLYNPIGVSALASLIDDKAKRKTDLSAVIVVSDNTRPVPYKGRHGILEPILDVLADRDIRRVKILVANGMHRALSKKELKEFLPNRVFEAGLTVTNHVCDDRSELRMIGRTEGGSEAWVNRHYLDADIKVLTGLVEPHFMAGVSGGRKSLCPGLSGERTTRVFHGVKMMADDRSDSLIIEENPCHKEAVDVALMAGADFIVNATIDNDRRLTGVYSGDMIKAHAAATARVAEANSISIRHEYDLVITHAGFVGVNHYQTAKSCVEAVKAVKPGGSVIVVANHTDPDPIGSENYKRLLPLINRHGSEGLYSALLAPDHGFMPDQWGVQIWARVFRKLKEFGHFVYCAPRLTGELFTRHALPGLDGGMGISGLEDRGYAEKMMQHAINRFSEVHPNALMAVLPDGPYGVPVLKS